MQSAPIRFSREKSRSLSSGRGADPAHAKVRMAQCSRNGPRRLDPLLTFTKLISSAFNENRWSATLTTR